MRRTAIQTAAWAVLSVPLAGSPLARAESTFDRIRDAVVSAVRIPPSVHSDFVRLAGPDGFRAPVVRTDFTASWTRTPEGGALPPFAMESCRAPALSDGQRTRIGRLRTDPPPIVRRSGDGKSVSVATGGLTPETARRISAKLVYEALQEGLENPTDSRWRPFLAELVAHPFQNQDADAVYQLLLAGFGGIDDDARMRQAEAWAARHEGGRFAGDMAYASVRAVFNAGDYRSVRRRAEAVAANHPAFAVRALLLAVLADAYESENARAQATLDALKRVHADSPEFPEILYTEAWLALETFREEDAKAILRRILRDHPSSGAARKAAQILDAL